MATLRRRQDRAYFRLDVNLDLHPLSKKDLGRQLLLLPATHTLTRCRKKVLKEAAQLRSDRCRLTLR